MQSLSYICNKYMARDHSVRRGWFPLPEGKNFDSPLNFLPPGSSETEFPSQEAFVIYIPTNCQGQLTAILWGEKSSSKLNRVIYDFKLAANRWNMQKKLFLTLLLNQHHYYFCVAMSSPLAWSRKIWFPPKKFLPWLSKFSMPPLPLKIPNSKISLPSWIQDGKDTMETYKLLDP